MGLSTGQKPADQLLRWSRIARRKFWRWLERPSRAPVLGETLVSVVKVFELA